MYTQDTDKTILCVVEYKGNSFYRTDKGWIDHNYCFCSKANTEVGDTIKVRERFLFEL